MHLAEPSLVLVVYLTLSGLKAQVTLTSLLKPTKYTAQPSNQVRLPIQWGLVKLLADQIDIEFLAKRTQPYLNVMRKAILMMGYFGLLRIGEMTIGESNRTICFSDVNFEHNRWKILILLRSSKMHTTTSKPQSMKIEHISGYDNKYCPCKIICDHTLMRGARRPKAPFFIFRDMTPVKADQFRSVLHRWYWTGFIFV